MTMTTMRIWRLLHRFGRGSGRGTSLLSMIAFAAANTILLTVLGGVHGFIWRVSPDHTAWCMVSRQHCRPGAIAQAAALSAKTAADTGAQSYGEAYVVLAIFACVLLAVPFVALAGSAARLSASRRDAQLAALRLIGATNAQVMRLTAVEAAGQAFVGALLGVAGYMALIPAVTLLTFQNRHFDFVQLWVGFAVIAVVCLGEMLLALISALVMLRRVAITPLGVMQRVARPLPTRWRAVIFAVAVVVSVLVLKTRVLASRMSTVWQIVIVIAVIVVCFALVNLVGTWAIAMRARRKVRHPRDAASMIAMRRILDNPKRAWRNVSGIALAVFIAGITSIAGYVGATVKPPHSSDVAGIWLLKDIGTGGLLTLGFAAVLAAVSCGVMQAGNVYEQEREYRMLMLEGTDAKTMNAARRIEVFMPLNTVVVISGGCSMLLMLPLMAGLMVDPTTLLFFFGGIAACYALVFIGVFAANRVAAGLDLVHYRADD